MAAISGELNQSLRNEQAWVEVAGGLGKVLLGYGALVLGWMVASAFFYSCYAPILNGKAVKIEHVWFYYIGVAILVITNLSSWGLILAGQWKCLMNSPERRGARWIIFFCMTCVVMGPVLHMLAWFGGLSTPIRLGAGPQAIQGVKLKFTITGIYVMCASLITTGLYKVSFWYYLQTVASCMGATKARGVVFLFVAITLAMVGATYWVLFGGLHPNKVRDLAIWVAAGWVFVALYWVFMIVVVKVAIEQTMAEVYNPMRETHRPQVQLAGS